MVRVLHRQKGGGWAAPDMVKTRKWGVYWKRHDRSEGQQWKHQAYLPFAHFGPPGTQGASSGGASTETKNMFGRLGAYWNSPRATATARCSTRRSARYLGAERVAALAFAVARCAWLAGSLGDHRPPNRHRVHSTHDKRIGHWLV